MAAFPLPTKQDAAKFGFEQEDVGMKSQMEGGYVLTRPRHTRTPRRTWTTGFTDLSNTDKATIEAFVNTHGTHLAFDYTIPVEDILVNVRFKEIPKYDYKGFGENLRWNIEMALEEV